MPNITHDIYFNFINVLAHALKIDTEQDGYKRRKGALIVDVHIYYLLQEGEEKFLYLLELTRKVIRENENVRKWIANNIHRIESCPLGDIRKLSLMIEFEEVNNDKSTPRFYEFFAGKIYEASSISDLQFLSDIYNFNWLFKRYNEKNKTPELLDLKLKLKKIRQLSIMALKKADTILIDGDIGVGTKSKVKEQKNIVIGIGFVPAHLEATHLNLIYITALSILNAFPKSNVYVAITSEVIGDSVYCVKKYSDEFSIELSEFWSNINNENDACYISKKSNIRDFSNWIKKIDPDIFFSVGGVFKTEIFTRLVYYIHNIPVVFLPASNSNEITFPVSGVLARNKEVYLKLSEEIRANNVFLLNFEYKPILNNEAYVGENIRKSEREDIGIIVLNSNRIAQWFESLSNTEIEKIESLFQYNEDLVMIFIGENQPERILNVDNRIRILFEKDKIRILKRVKNLRGLYRLVDFIFTLPGITGGGGAVDCALHDNLPAICWKEHDSCLNVPDQYQYDNIDGMINIISNIINIDETKKQIIKSYQDLKDNENKYAWQKALDYWSK